MRSKSDYGKIVAGAAKETKKERERAEAGRGNNRECAAVVRGVL